MDNKNYEFVIKEETEKRIRETSGVDLSEEFFDKEDVKAMINAIDNPRDKVLISILWETGGRISEIYDISLEDIVEQEKNKSIILNGITGKRKIPIRESIKSLKNWLSKHPERKNSEASLWLDQEGEKITYNHIRKTIQKAADEAGIQKINNPQHIRRSRAAYLTKILSQEEVRKWFGWTEESDLTGLEKDCSDCSGCPFSCSMG